jgi:hypothetical protein
MAQNVNMLFEFNAETDTAGKRPTSRLDYHTTDRGHLCAIAMVDQLALRYRPRHSCLHCVTGCYSSSSQSTPTPRNLASAIEYPSRPTVRDWSYGGATARPPGDSGNIFTLARGIHVHEGESGGTAESDTIESNASWTIPATCSFESLSMNHNN